MIPGSQNGIPALAAVRKNAWVLTGVVMLLAVTATAYAPALRSGYVWDDDVYLTGNRLLTAPDGLRRIWFSLDSPSQYFPLVYTSFRVEHSLWGLAPAGYHAVNVLLHTLNALLLWGLLHRLGVPGAWMAGMLFAIHPVQVESVAWITERKNVLSVFFSLLALHAWFSFVDEPGAGARSRWRYCASFALLCLSLFAKTTACTLPLAMVLVAWLREGKVRVRRLLQMGPFLAAGVALGLVTVWWERHRQGTAGPAFEYGLAERCLIAGRALWFYLGKLLWPADLSFSYPRWEIDAWSPAQYVWPAAVVIAGAALWRSRRATGPGPLVAAIFFAGTLSPLLGFIPLYTFRFSYVADHYQYFAAAGPMTLAAALVARACEKAPGGWVTSSARRVIPATVVVVLGTLTWRQAGAYRDEITLWSTTTAVNPGSWMAHGNLGSALLRSGRPAEAAQSFEKSLAIMPEQSPALEGLAEALGQLGRVDEAISGYREAIHVQPAFFEAHYNLANLLAETGRVRESVDHYAAALGLRPGDDQATNNLGVALLRQGRREEAELLFLRAAKLNPANPMPHVNLGTMDLSAGRPASALERFEEALRLAPGSAPVQKKIADTRRQLGIGATGVRPVGPDPRMSADPAVQRMSTSP